MVAVPPKGKGPYRAHAHARPTITPQPHLRRVVAPVMARLARNRTRPPSPAPAPPGHAYRRSPSPPRPPRPGRTRPAGRPDDPLAATGDRPRHRPNPGHRGGDIERLALRVRFRVATADLATVRDSYAWATRRALPRRGCHNPDCEDGHLWSTGQECRACAEALTRRRTSRTEGTRPTPAPAAPGSVPVATWRCGTCGTPGTGDPPASSQCHTCWANTPEGATDFLAASLARPAEPAPGAPDNPPDLPGTTTYRAMRAALRARSPA